MVSSSCGVSTHIGWRRCIGCLKLQVSFCKRATNYRVLLRKMTYKDKASDAFALHCICWRLMTCVLTHLHTLYSHLHSCQETRWYDLFPTVPVTHVDRKSLRIVKLLFVRKWTRIQECSQSRVKFQILSGMARGTRQFAFIQNFPIRPNPFFPLFTRVRVVTLCQSPDWPPIVGSWADVYRRSTGNLGKWDKSGKQVVC